MVDTSKNILRADIISTRHLDGPREQGDVSVLSLGGEMPKIY
jgi:hypothetical protein